jgi:hypothetical protein
VAIGVATNQMTLWLPIGIALGLAIGAAIRMQSRPPK